MLAAGLGTRLQPLTSWRAKPALPVAGETLVERIIEGLSSQGVRDLVLNLHHLPETVTGVLGDGGAHGVRIRYSFEQLLLGSAGGPRRSSGERSRSKGKNICSREAVKKPIRVALKSLHLSKQIMRKSDRLRALQMRVARNDHFDVVTGESDKCPLQIAKLFAQKDNFLAQPQPDIQRHLVIA